MRYRQHAQITKDVHHLQPEKQTLFDLMPLKDIHKSKLSAQSQSFESSSSGSFDEDDINELDNDQFSQSQSQQST